MQIVQCDDRTCRHNSAGYCLCQALRIELGGRKTVFDAEPGNICVSYEERIDESDRKQNGS